MRTTGDKKLMNWEKLNLNYSGENNPASFLVSRKNVHPYPAKLVPELVSDILNNICQGNNIKNVLDPFVGSGTTALESNYLGLNFYGSDLNPLAILIAKTKVLKISNNEKVIGELNKFSKSLKGSYSINKYKTNVDFKNINYWFKRENIHQLSFLKFKIDTFLLNQPASLVETYGLILLNAFSACVKSSSLSRNNEFKLYRMSPNDIEKFNVNSINIFIEKLTTLLVIIEDTNLNCIYNNDIKIDLRNAKNIDFIKNEKIDLVLTSPPYGDSRSTVAYGQFSRLPLQWMGDLMNKHLKIPVFSENCDEMLLGGKESYVDLDINIILKASKTLCRLFEEIDRIVYQELELLQTMENELDDVFLKIKEGQPLKREMFSDNLFELISERVRLDNVRKLNEEAKLSSREIKELSIKNKEKYFNMLFNKEKKLNREDVKNLHTKLIRVRDTIKRKLKSVPKRKEEVVNFFKDLYQVLIETDRVLKKQGIQVWVVGHRTILGKVQINMKEVLNDWFNWFGYEKITDLSRQYSFKRLPHHINSTINRNDKVSTMMKEYILIVKKK